MRVRPGYLHDTHLKWVRHLLAVEINTARVNRDYMYADEYIVGLLFAKHCLDGKYGSEAQTGIPPK